MNQHISNKIIAEFMGYEYIPHSKDSKYYPGYWNINATELAKTCPSYHKFNKSLYLCRCHRDLKYDVSWDWLMPVVEKIEDLDPNPRITHAYSVEITGNGTTIQPNVYIANNRWMIRHNSHNNRLANTHKSVIEFIIKYNER